MNPLTDPSNRRLLALIAGVVTPVLNGKLGLAIPDEQVLGVLGLVAMYIGAGNWKSVALAKAAQAGKEAAAAASVVPAAEGLKAIVAEEKAAQS
jgi:XapX domain-containing protein